MNRALPLLWLPLAACATASQFYPLSELQALDPVEDRAELLAHAPQVAPSQRTAGWRAVVEQASIATLAQLEVKDAATAEQALALVDAQPQKFPFLARSPDWLSARAALGVKALPWLANEGERGSFPRRVLEFAKKDAVTPQLAQRLADEVLLKQLIASTASSLAELAFERDGAAACGWPTAIKMTVELAGDGSTFKPALEKCWKQLVGPMTDAAAKSETRTAKLKLCAVMSDHAAEPAVKSACAE
ncbi:MAG: hypothetical protein IT380_18115 [Myxococcales bacterium]|nr:hypothetical protein [Myxococcales bacterium]